MTRVASNQLLALLNRLCWFIKPASVGLESTRIGSTSSLYWNGLIPYALSPDHKAVKSTSHVAYSSFDPKVNSLTGQFRLQIILPTARFAQESFHQQGFFTYKSSRLRVGSPSSHFAYRSVSPSSYLGYRSVSPPGHLGYRSVSPTSHLGYRSVSPTVHLRYRSVSPTGQFTLKSTFLQVSFSYN